VSDPPRFAEGDRIYSRYFGKGTVEGTEQTFQTHRVPGSERGEVYVAGRANLVVRWDETDLACPMESSDDLRLIHPLERLAEEAP